MAFKTVPVMTSVVNDESEDFIAQATQALIDYGGGFAELDRRHVTIDDYLDGKVPGLDPDTLIEKMTSAVPAWP